MLNLQTLTLPSLIFDLSPLFSKNCKKLAYFKKYIKHKLQENFNFQIIISMTMLRLGICSLLLTANKKTCQKSQNACLLRKSLLSTTNKQLHHFFVLPDSMTLSSFCLLLLIAYKP